MEKRNLDVGIDVTRDQWDMLGRTAARLGPADGGYGWDEDRPREIAIFLRDEDAPGHWRDFVTDEAHYGAHERRIAWFRFNDGRPFARIDPPDSLVEQPAVDEETEQRMQTEIEHWVRDRWHALMRESGLHYDRGHIPQS